MCCFPWAIFGRPMFQVLHGFTLFAEAKPWRKWWVFSKYSEALGTFWMYLNVSDVKFAALCEYSGIPSVAMVGRGYFLPLQSWINFDWRFRTQFVKGLIKPRLPIVLFSENRNRKPLCGWKQTCHKHPRVLLSLWIGGFIAGFRAQRCFMRRSLTRRILPNRGRQCLERLLNLGNLGWVVLVLNFWLWIMNRNYILTISNQRNYAKM